MDKRTIITDDFMSELEQRQESLHGILDTKNTEPLIICSGDYKYRVSRFSRLEYVMVRLMTKELERLEKLLESVKTAD